jgi:hypothetical protein
MRRGRKRTSSYSWTILQTKTPGPTPAFRDLTTIKIPQIPETGRRRRPLVADFAWQQIPEQTGCPRRHRDD